MPVDASIPLGIKVPDQFTTLNNILNMRKNQMELQKMQATMQSDIARSQAESQTAQNQARVSTANVNPLIQQQAAQTATAQTAAKAAEFKLTGEQKQKAMDITNAFANDPDFNFKDAPEPSKYSLDQKDQFAKDVKDYTDKKTAAMLGKIWGSVPTMVGYGIPIDKVIEQATALARIATNKPEAVPDALKHALASGVSGNAQREMMTPQYQNVGGQQVNINPVANAPALQNTLPPSSREEVIVDASGKKLVQTKSPEGTIQSTRLMPGSTTAIGEPITPQSSNFTQFEPGQAKDIENSQQEVTAIRNAGDQVPNQRKINSEILSLSKSATTGPGTPFWQKKLAALSLGKFGDNYQELGKFLEKNALNNLASMGGPPSDARLSAATAANGSTEFNPGALQAVTKFNDATTTALEKYRQGIDAAVGTTNPKFAKHPEFKSQWAKNLDIDVFRVENAIRDKDTMELQKVKQELGPDRMKELAVKRQNLEKLSRDGHL